MLEGLGEVRANGFTGEDWRLLMVEEEGRGERLVMNLLKGEAKGRDAPPVLELVPPVLPRGRGVVPRRLEVVPL